jgi:hypothetical protein
MDIHFSGGHSMTPEELRAHAEWLKCSQKILEKYGRIAYILYNLGGGLTLLMAYTLVWITAALIALIVSSPFILLMYLLGGF